jgi:uncharacterized protein (TIGR03067 family)
MKALFFAVLIAAAVAAAPAPAADNIPRGDLARLQGRWTTRAGPKQEILVGLEIEGHQVKVNITLPRGMKLLVHGELRIDDRVTPRALDWTKFTGLDSQELPEIRAIYELEGDTFKVCNGGPDNERPTQFKAGDGILAECLTFTRAKAQPQASEDVVGAAVARR